METPNSIFEYQENEQRIEEIRKKAEQKMLKMKKQCETDGQAAKAELILQVYLLLIVYCLRCTGKSRRVGGPFCAACQCSTFQEFFFIISTYTLFVSLLFRPFINHHRQKRTFSFVRYAVL